jgi:glycosyltransferase involved in cell wall biosynthesis
MLAYWGSFGGLPKLTLELGQAATTSQSVKCSIAISRSNELYDAYHFLGDALFAAPTFRNKPGAFFSWKSLLNLRSSLVERFRRDDTRAFVSLAPHVWSPLLGPVVRRAGVRHIVVAHDASAHPGDLYGPVNRWLLREAVMADHVITLSNFVAQGLAAYGIPERRISVLFHPDLDYAASPGAIKSDREPLRILFMGRLFKYKGLRLFVDALELLRRSGVPIVAGVHGWGKIDPPLRGRLTALGATVVNRYIPHQELPGIFLRYDLVVASHIEASQSGVIASAFGAGLPVVVTPVGGLVDQVTSGVNGIVAQSVTADAVAAAIRVVVEDPTLLARLREGVAATRQERSVTRFFDQICRIALGPQS